MMKRINCKFNDNGAWCTNLNIKKSLWGIGSRCCIEYPDYNPKKCEFKEEHSRPSAPPAPPKYKNRIID